MVAATLFVGTSAQKLAHDPVEMPLPALLLLSFNHLTELHQKLDVFPILLLRPVGSRVQLLNWRAVIKTIHHFLGPEHPRFKFTQLPAKGGRSGSILRGFRGILLAAVTHFWCLIILLKWKILLKLKAIQKPWIVFGINDHKGHEDIMKQKNVGLFLPENGFLMALQQKWFENNDIDSDNLNVIVFNTKISIRLSHKTYCSILILSYSRFIEMFIRPAFKLVRIQAVRLNYNQKLNQLPHIFEPKLISSIILRQKINETPPKRISEWFLSIVEVFSTPNNPYLIMCCLPQFGCMVCM